MQQPDTNLGPQLGIAWDPWKNGRTLVRGGIGVYYENNLFSDIRIDRTVRLATAPVFGSLNLCQPGVAVFPGGQQVAAVDGLNIASQICGQPLGAVINRVVVGDAIADLQQQYQSAVAGASGNPYFVGNSLQTFGGALAPTYQSPRSVQMNLGFQRQFGRNSLLSVDWVRNVSTHYLLGVDTNHVGDSNHLDVDAALAAITATLQAKAPQCLPGVPLTAGSSSQAAIACYLSKVSPASMADFASNGLDSANAYCGGFPCSIGNLRNAAFPGVNKQVGSSLMYFPSGRSVYSAYQISLRTGIERPARPIRRMDLLLSYTRSRYKDNIAGEGRSVQGDQDVLARAVDYNHPLSFYGPASLDRTHQFSYGPVWELPKGLRLSVVGHLDSPLPVTLFLPQLNGGGAPGEIFHSDIDGDGTVGDVLPGTNLGAFGRSVKTSALNDVLKAYFNSLGGVLTPAGLALVNAQLFTQPQLVTLGAVTPGPCGPGGAAPQSQACISLAPPGNVGQRWLRTVDARLTWPFRVREGLTIEPSVSAFNAANFANFDAPSLLLSGILDGSPGRAVNATTGQSTCSTTVTCRSNRATSGSGVFSQASPRQLEFGLRVNF